MAVYSIESAMENYNIKNNNIKKLEKELLAKEDFIAVITMYDFDYKGVNFETIYTDKKSYEMDKNEYLEGDYPFSSKTVKDKDRDREMER